MNEPLLTKDFFYDLPEDRIAHYPTEKRDQSKLLVYNKREIEHDRFSNIIDHLPKSSLLVFNNSKVIPARLKFKKATGAAIEIFLLAPADNKVSAHRVLTASSPVRWKCVIGNKKRWSGHDQLKCVQNSLELSAQLINDSESIVEFSWNTKATWSEVLEKFGDIPLPPYINRPTEDADSERYQTVYSKLPGAVAAPTAGLHFTPEIISDLHSKGIKSVNLTLHVSAGTFQPIKSEIATDHQIHSEKIYFTKGNIESLLKHDGSIIAVGTTSCRSLESLYWFGKQLIDSDDLKDSFNIDQSFPYQKTSKQPTRSESLSAITAWMTKNDVKSFSGSTSIYIYPGYQFKMTDGLITNFHQPGSTLLLLISAFVGQNWRRIYESALRNNYRFLSYGDSSILFP